MPPFAQVARFVDVFDKNDRTPINVYRYTMAQPMHSPELASDLRAMIQSGQAHDLRVSAGLSFSAVARKCEVSHMAVSRWERGERHPQGRNIRVYHELLKSLVDH